MAQQMELKSVQVSTYWNWGDVHAADKYLEELERLRDSTRLATSVYSVGSRILICNDLMTTGGHIS